MKRVLAGFEHIPHRNPVNAGGFQGDFSHLAFPLCRERWTPGKLSTFLHVLDASWRRRQSVVPRTTASVRTTLTGGLKKLHIEKTASDCSRHPRCGDRHGPLTAFENIFSHAP
jgi:hypothetical protein